MGRFRKFLYSVRSWITWPLSVERRLFIHSDRLQHLYSNQEDGERELQKQVDELRLVLDRHTNQLAELRNLEK